MKENIEISEILHIADKGIEEMLVEVSKSFSGKVILGYNTIAINTEKSIATENINRFNSLLNAYTKLLNVGLSIETFQEMTRLTDLNPEQLKFELQKAYLTTKKVQYNYPGLKISVLVEAYDYPDTDLQIISDMVNLSKRIIPSKKVKYDKYWNDEKKALEFTTEHEKEIIAKHTRYASEAKLSEIICLHLLCTSLNNLKDKDYSFKQLPELDYKIMSSIRIISDNELAVDIKTMLGESFEEEIVDMEVELLGKNMAGLPVVKVQGEYYELAHPRMSGIFVNNSPGGTGEYGYYEVTDMASLSLPENREKLIKTISILLRKQSTGIRRLEEEEVILS